MFGKVKLGVDVIPEILKSRFVVDYTRSMKLRNFEHESVV